jgi:cellulose synthase/poly-beta-1,6-N-acetylglucosamine synthase-like glycosyltransferase
MSTKPEEQLADKLAETSTRSSGGVFSYFPLRYLLAAFFFSFIFLTNVDILYQIEGYVLATVIDNLRPVQVLYSERAFSSISGIMSYESAIPVFSQILFLIFFPTIALTARINPRMRAKILLFGLLCFFAFILTQLLLIVIILGYDLSIPPESYTQISIIATLTVGGLIIELMLFSSLILPSRTRVKPIVRRRYVREYATFIGIVASSSVLVYSLLSVLDITTDSPISLYLALNIVAVMVFGYYLSFFVYALRPPTWLRWSNLPTSTRDGSTTSYSISFLLPARNEEKIIERCLRSIDAAASKYPGKTEIILVNDGSTDNTEKLATEVMADLRSATGKVFSIPPSGKGHALQYGLKRTSGDIIFRIDADSVVAEDAIWPIITHFKNPQVGSVSGMIFPLEPKKIWQKSIGLMFIYYMSVVKRGQELFDSILVQAGAFSVFRKDALLKIGGWAMEQFGEDGEITNRMGRYGYRNELELASLLYTEVPDSLTHFMYQRSRWSIAFYHARGRNLDLVRNPAGYKSPRAIVFLIGLLTHGLAFAHGLMLPYLAANVMVSLLPISSGAAPLEISFEAMPQYLEFAKKFVLLQGIIMVMQVVVIAYYLPRYGKLGHIRYYPMLPVIGLILSTMVRPLALEILLSWSSKHKEYDDDAYGELTREMKRSIDPIGL